MNLKFISRLIIVVVFSLVGALVCGYQIFGESRDYRNYFDFFDIVRATSGLFDIYYRFEPGFMVWVYLLVKAGFDNISIYSIIVFSIIFIKYFALRSSDKYWIVFFIFSIYYVSRYFLLFEMTVLRGATALSLAFYVFYRKDNGGFKFKEILILVFAVGFHYSSAVFIPIYFFKPNSRFKIVVISVFSFVAIMVFKTVALNFLSDFIGGFSEYGKQEEATLFPLPMFFDLFLLIFSLLMFKYADVAMRYAVLGLSLSMAFHFALIDFTVFSNRFRELLSVFILIYVVRAFLCRSVLVKAVSGGYLIITSVIYLYGYLIYDPLLS